MEVKVRLVLSLALIATAMFGGAAIIWFWDQKPEYKWYVTFGTIVLFIWILFLEHKFVKWEIRKNYNSHITNRERAEQLLQCPERAAQVILERIQ